MIKAFQEGKDIYASIASVAFKVPYEQCLEFHPETHEYQPEGKERRSQAKFIVLGICYGRSVPSIAEQLYGTRTDMTDERKTKEAQIVYDSVLNSFPNLRKLMVNAQGAARKYGYVETILGRRRHIPEMQLPEFEFLPMKGYVNPDVDPLDVSTLNNSEAIPKRIVDSLQQEFHNYKYFGQIAKRTKELYDQKIKVVNNRPKINDGARQCVNCVDYATEILTTSGWKPHDQVKVGDEILSYSLQSHQIVRDHINAVLDYPGERSAVLFDTPTFSAVSTSEHRWVIGESDETPRIKTTADIYMHKWPDYPILRVGDNSFEDNLDITDDQLKILGWILTDGCIDTHPYAIHIYQSTKHVKNSTVYEDMINTLNSVGIDVTDRCVTNGYHEIYLKKCEFTSWVCTTFPDRVLTFEFVSTLSQRQAGVLMRAMLQGDGTGVDGHGQPLPNSTIRMCCRDKARCDVFQYLCFVAGYATNVITVDNSLVDYPSNHIQYDSMNNVPKSQRIYYDVAVLRVQRAHIYPHHKFMTQVDGVWCVSTEQGTWIARRNNKVFITGNSIIQGSAADQTKLAMLKLEADPRWNALGGRLLIPVHDELIAEVPAENWEEGGRILSEVMCEAANFLPFPSKCDVTTTYRWYGLEYPCMYERPESLEGLDEHPDQVKWVQYMLTEMEYQLPVLPEPDGTKPRGDAAHGVNGQLTDEFWRAVNDYKHRYNIHTDEEFIEHIFNKVDKGV